jgi:hypothetical protein
LCGQLDESPQALCYCREGEFELGAARTPQTQSGETQDALQGGEQQIDLFAIVTRLRVGVGFGECAGDIASTRRVRTIYEIQAIYGHYARLSRLGSFTSNSLVATSIAVSAAAASTPPMYLARCRAREVDFPGEQRR